MLGLTLALLAGACAQKSPPLRSPLVQIKEGSFWMGSDPDERAHAVESLASHDPQAWRHMYTWIKNELPRQQRSTSSYEIMRFAVTQYDYHRFVLETGHSEPFISEANWAAMQTHIPYAEVRSLFWTKGQPRKGRARHPVTFVSHVDAESYCAWWGQNMGGKGRLPTEDEWERAARGDQGNYYPWGNNVRPALLNAYESKILSTTPVSAFAGGASPHGVLGMAGNVLEWTSTPGQGQDYIVKGGAYELSAAMARPAARHARPSAQKHAVIGFRCVFVRDLN